MTATLQAPSITVAICTRDRPAQLRRALASVTAAQSLPPLEVLVIDSRPADDRTRQIVQTDFGQVRYVREDRPGVGFARDRALREAHCEIVAFIDDDAVADPDWLRAIARVMLGPDAPVACTGRVEALVLDTEAQRLFEANGGFDRGIGRIELPHDAARRLHGLPAPLIAWAVSIGNACNLALDRRAALSVGGFDGTFGVCAALPAGEDLDLIWRLISGGMTVVYEPRAMVRHEHRCTMDGLSRQLAGHQRGIVGFLTKAAIAARGTTRLQAWLFLGWRLVKPAVRLTRRIVGRDALPAGMLLRIWWHAAAAPAAYLRARQQAAALPSVQSSSGNHG